MSEARFPGESIRLGEKEMIIPSLSVRQAKELWPEILELGKVTLEDMPKHWVSGMKVIHAAITRNYPAIKVDELEELIDLSNFSKIMKAVSGQSGLTPAPGPQPAASTTERIM